MSIDQTQPTPVDEHAVRDETVKRALANTALARAKELLADAYAQLAHAGHHAPEVTAVAGIAGDVDDARRAIDKLLSPAADESD